MVKEAILLGVVAMFGNAEYLCGTTMWSRPMVMGALTGIVMGNISLGVQIGATLELAFMGALAIGASLPPNMVSGTVLGTAFAITTGMPAQTALTFALPIASLVVVILNLGMIFIVPSFLHRADKDAKEANIKGVARMHFLGGFFGVNLILGVIVGLSFQLGQPVMQGVIDSIPQWVQTGLTVAMGLLPAIGFGLLMQMIINKEVACFFALGFALSEYLKIPVTGVAIFGAIFAIILVQIKNQQEKMMVGGDDDDF